MTLQAVAWCHVSRVGDKNKKANGGGQEVEPAPDSSPAQPLGYRGQTSGRTSSLITHQKCQKLHLPKYSLCTLKKKKCLQGPVVCEHTGAHI